MGLYSICKTHLFYLTNIFKIHPYYIACTGVSFFSWLIIFQCYIYTAFCLPVHLLMENWVAAIHMGVYMISCFHFFWLYTLKKNRITFNLYWSMHIYTYASNCMAWCMFKFFVVHKFLLIGYFHGNSTQIKKNSTEFSRVKSASWWHEYFFPSSFVFDVQLVVNQTEVPLHITAGHLSNFYAPMPLKVDG